MRKTIADLHPHAPAPWPATSGTSGLHLAMLMAGVGRGDEVLVPALTFIAAVNPIRYAGRRARVHRLRREPVPVPGAGRGVAGANTEQRDGKCVNRHTGAHVKALLVVHVFGNMANMPGLVECARKYGLVRSLRIPPRRWARITPRDRTGAKWPAPSATSACTASTATRSSPPARAAWWCRTTRIGWSGRSTFPPRRNRTSCNFVHDEVGYNYRLTNLQAALGLAQMEQLEGFIAHKNEMYDFYNERLNGKHGYRILPFRDGRALEQMVLQPVSVGRVARAPRRCYPPRLAAEHPNAACVGPHPRAGRLRRKTNLRRCTGRAITWRAL